jgi:prevent-host-death family protein
MKLSESIQPISYVKANASEVVDRVCETGEPVIVTQNGRARVIIQDLKTYERTQETLAILELARQGDEDIAAGRTQPIDKAFESLKKEIRKKYPASKL